MYNVQWCRKLSVTRKFVVKLRNICKVFYIVYYNLRNKSKKINLWEVFRSGRGGKLEYKERLE